MAGRPLNAGRVINLPTLHRGALSPVPRPLALGRPGQVAGLSSSLPSLPTGHSMVAHQAYHRGRSRTPHLRYHPLVQACRNDLSHQVYLLNRRHRKLKKNMRKHSMELQEVAQKIHREEAEMRLRQDSETQTSSLGYVIPRKKRPVPTFKLPAIDIDLKVRHARKLKQQAETVVDELADSSLNKVEKG